MQNTIIKTKDGSTTIFVPSLNEHYHSVNGAFNESMLVFIKNGLECIDKKEINVFEVGFGTGLNALLTYRYAKENNKTIYYESIEKYPVDDSLTEKLIFPDFVDQESEKLIREFHSSAWDDNIILNKNFTLHKVLGDIDAYKPTVTFDVIYFDAFAPDKQPNLWTKDIFQLMCSILNKGGVLTTYCAKGVVRRTMEEIGFVVKRLPGPLGKREMIQAKKPM